jgi:hypothetical protein
MSSACSNDKFDENAVVLTLFFISFPSIHLAQRYDLRQENLLDVWANECLRIFCDRLVGDGKKKLHSVLSGILRQDWDHTLKDKNIYCGFSPELQDVPPDDFGNRKLFSCSADDYVAMLSESLRLYQRETKDLRVVLFREVLELVEKIDRFVGCLSSQIPDRAVVVSFSILFFVFVAKRFNYRVLCMRGGSLFLVGNSGSSRRSMISLLCHIHRMDLLTLSLTRDYGTREFRMDLKNVLHHDLLIMQAFPSTSRSFSPQSILHFHDFVCWNVSSWRWREWKEKKLSYSWKTIISVMKMCWNQSTLC